MLKYTCFHDISISIGSFEFTLPYKQFKTNLINRFDRVRKVFENKLKTVRKSKHILQTITFIDAKLSAQLWLDYMSIRCNRL